MTASTFDCIVLGIIALSAFFGFRKGFVMQVFGLLSILIGVYCAFKFSNIVAEQISKYLTISDPHAFKVISFIITMIIVWITIIVLGKFMETMIKVSALGFINRLLGVLFASLKTLAVLCALLYAFSFLGVSKNKDLQKEFNKSIMYEPMMQISETVFPYIKFKDFL